MSTEVWIFETHTKRQKKAEPPLGLGTFMVRGPEPLGNL